MHLLLQIYFITAMYLLNSSLYIQLTDTEQQSIIQSTELMIAKTAACESDSRAGMKKELSIPL